VLVAEYVTPTNPTADEVESLWNDFYSERDAASASASAGPAPVPTPPPGGAARDDIHPMCGSDSDSDPGPATPTRPLAV